MNKPKKPRSEKQLANDARLREKAKARREANQEEDFEPTEVQEKRAAEEAKVSKEDLVAPVPQEDAEQIETSPQDNQPVSTAPQLTSNLDMNTITTIAVAVATALQQNPGIRTAPPEEKFRELETAAPNTNNRQHTARLGAGGEVQGVVNRYEVSRDYYPDPTQKLLDEPRLARFAMRENFIFRWEVDGVEYKKNNITYAEPRFTLELFRKIYDEDGQPTGKAALVARQMQHEDEFTTRIMAMKMGVLDQYDDTDEGFRALMSEMRYERFRQWLLGIFTPAKIETHRKRPLTQVIAGKVVEVYDTEQLTDHDSAAAKTSAIQSDDGVGKVATPSI